MANHPNRKNPEPLSALCRQYAKIAHGKYAHRLVREEDFYAALMSAVAGARWAHLYGRTPEPDRQFVERAAEQLARTDGGGYSAVTFSEYATHEQRHHPVWGNPFAFWGHDGCPSMRDADD